MRLFLIATLGPQDEWGTNPQLFFNLFQERDDPVVQNKQRSAVQRKKRSFRTAKNEGGSTRHRDPVGREILPHSEPKCTFSDQIDCFLCLTQDRRKRTVLALMKNENYKVVVLMRVGRISEISSFRTRYHHCIPYHTIPFCAYSLFFQQRPTIPYTFYP